MRSQLHVGRLLEGSDYSKAMFPCLNCAQRVDNRALGSSRELVGAAKHLIDVSEKCIHQLSFEF